MNRWLNIIVRASALVAANLILGVGTANAGAIFRGTFDPPLYGGTVFVDLPDPGCFTTDGWIPTGTLTCGDVVIDSLLVQNPNTGAPNDTLTFATPISGAVSGLWWVGGALTAIDSSSIFTPGSGGPFFTEPTYELIFESGHAPSLPSGPSDVLLFACSNFGCDGGDRTFVGDEAATQRGFVQVQVPEPGSVTLVLGAIAAAWFARRRRNGDSSI